MPPVISTTPPVWMAATVSKWLGPRRYFYHPNCVEPVRSLAIVSSRLARPFYEQTNWFAKLKRALAFCQENNKVLLTSAKTTTDPFIRAYTAKHHIRLATTTICHTLKQWRTRINNREVLQPLECWISPPADGTSETYQTFEQLPESDRLLIGGAHEVFVIDCRHKSKTQQLLNLRQQEIGLLEWSVIPKTGDTLNDYNPRQYKTKIPFWVGQTGTLAHWTRAIDGPWPQQSETSWYNQLIRGQKEADHSAFATLCNIITQQNILSSHRAIRGGYEVVCLTATPLEKWKDLNIYRPHLRRWDFCPYGILLSPSVSRRLPIKKVRYGDKRLWNSLNPKEKPFFQAIDGKADWKVEQEYRIVGDLSLRTLKQRDLVVFTETATEANALQTYSSWPVVPFENLTRLARIQT